MKLAPRVQKKYWKGGLLPKVISCTVGIYLDAPLFDKQILRHVNMYVSSNIYDLYPNVYYIINYSNGK